MFNKLECEVCGKSESTIVTKKEIIPVRGENIEIESTIRICKCGNEIFDEDLEEKNLTKAYDKYRRRHNLLSPEDIKRIREKYGISQRTLGKILGWGEITVHRYENGSIPNPSHHKMLKFLEEPQIMKKLLEEAKDSIPQATYKRIIDNINSALCDKESAELIRIIESRFKHTDIDIMSGYKQFDFNKICNVILFFAHNINELWITKLNKLLNFTDALYFSKYTVSLTGMKYRKFEYGPVPEEYEVLLWLLQQAGYISKVRAINGPYKGVIIKALCDFDKDTFTQQEIAVLNDILLNFGESTSTYLSDLSHIEEGWINTPIYGYIPYSYTNNLPIN